MELQETMAYVSGCFRDEPASCECACPFTLEIRSFLKKAARGRWPAAYRDLSAAIPFPSVAAELCPRPCEQRCQRTVLGDDPVDMGALERACLRFAASEKAAEYPISPKTQRIAVAGAGPAGLACALALARKKYIVTIFDTAPGWGGHLRGHEKFASFEADFAKQFSSQNVEFRFGTEADGETLGGFDAVYIATGDPEKDFGLGKSWDSTLFTTGRPGWFMGGGAAGMPLMESMAAAKQLSQLIEAYLQTGRAALIVEQTGKDCPGHFVEHPGEPSKPGIVPADGENYTKEEAKAEASRCMQCICEGCMSGCEMMAHYRKTPAQLAVEISGDSHTVPPFSNCEATRQTYSCNLCGDCASRCPEGIDLSALFRLSRTDRWQRGKWIAGAHDYWLRTLDFNGGEGFYASKGKCSRVFFPGCQLTASAPGQVLAAWHWMRKDPGSGIILGCCGAPADWAGDMDRQKENTGKLRTAWEEMGRPGIVAACAACMDQLGREIPEACITSLYELLDREGAPSAALPFGEAAVFDPCAARRDDLMHRSVRSLAGKAGCTAEDLPGGGNCCGYGGHIRLANPALYGEITENRISESEKPYIVYCANCLEVFRSKGKQAEHILSAVFGKWNAGTPTLEQKRNNALRVKGTVMEELENIKQETVKQPWDGLKLEFPGSVRADMEEKLITDSDVAEAIYTAEREKDYFEDGEGLRTACLMKKVLTFWADYREISPDTFRVENAYCHRMHIGGEAAK